MLLPLLIAAVVGYLLGALPFGYLVARAKGVNIFAVGSRNPGATNVRRVLGNGPGNVVLALDVAKGAAATFAPWGWRLAAGVPTLGRDAETYGYLAIAGLIGSLLGHSFSCFTHFRGGKGVATGGGGFLVLFPSGALVALIVWGAVVIVTRYISLASIAAALALPVVALVLHRSTALVGVSAGIAAFVIWRHRENISRLLAGTESKIGRKVDAPKS